MFRRKKQGLVLILLGSLLFSTLSSMASDDRFLEGRAEAYFQGRDGREIVLKDVIFSPPKLVLSLGKHGLFLPQRQVYSREVEASVDEATMLEVTEDYTTDNFSCDEKGVVKLWIKVFYTNRGNEMLITRVQSHIENAMPQKYQPSHYLMRVACEDMPQVGQRLFWRDLPLKDFDEKTGFKTYVDTGKGDQFDAFARGQVSLQDAKTKAWLGTVYVNVSPRGGRQ